MVTVLLSLFFGLVSSAQTQKPAQASTTPQKVIIDTDIGDDNDDAFAVALKSPELQILGISTTFSDTEACAKILDLILGESGRSDIPVLAGTPTHTTNLMTQRRYACRGTRIG